MDISTQSVQYSQITQVEWIKSKKSERKEKKNSNVSHCLCCPLSEMSCIVWALSRWCIFLSPPKWNSWTLVRLWVEPQMRRVYEWRCFRKTSSCNTRWKQHMTLKILYIFSYIFSWRVPWKWLPWSRWNNECCLAFKAAAKLGALTRTQTKYKNLFKVIYTYIYKIDSWYQMLVCCLKETKLPWLNECIITA